MAHNHPSGVAAPSAADRRVTFAMREACSLVGVALLDHLIVTGNGHFSFGDEEGWE